MSKKISSNIEKISIVFQPRSKKMRTRSVRAKRLYKKNIAPPKLEFFVMEIGGNLTLCGACSEPSLDPGFSPRKEHARNLRTLLSLLPESQNRLIKFRQPEYYYPIDYLRIK